MSVTELTDAQKMQVVYAYFTLEEWQHMSACVWDCYNTGDRTMDKKTVMELLTKFPSAVL